MDLKFTGEFFVPGGAPAHLEAEHQERYRFARRFASGRRILDLACGTGYGSHQLAEAGARQVDGVDLSPAVLAHARSHYKAPNLTFSQGDICAWRSAEPYDLITCFETIEHVPDHLAALANLRTLLASAGQLLISTPNRPLTSPRAPTLADRPANPYHVREFTLRELTGALHEAGFAIAANGLHGQRHQLHVPWPLLRKTYRTIFKPEYRTSPVVTPIGRLHPQYIVIVAVPA